MAESGEQKRERLFPRLLIAASVIGAAFLLQLSMMEYFSIEAPFLAFYPAVIIVAIYAGIWPGVAATLLVGVLAWVWVFEPRGSFALSRRSDAVSILVFIGMGLFISVMAERYRRKQQRIADLEKERFLRGSEEKLRASEEHFQNLANAIPQLTWMANSDGWIFWYNDRWYSYTGTTPEEMEGWGWRSVHDPEALPKVLEQWNASLTTGEPFNMVFPLRGADGIFRPFLTRVMPVKNSAGDIVRWFGTNTEISEQRKIEETLRSSEARLQGIIGSAMDAIISVNEQQRIVVFNQAAERVFQCTASDAIGSTLDRFIPTPSREVHREHIRRFGADSKTARSMVLPGLFTAFRCNGEAFPIEATISKVQTDGQLLFTVILRDITERKHSEEALQKSKARLDLAIEVACLGEWEIDLIAGTGSRSLRHAEIFGYTSTEQPWNFSKFLEHVLPEHRTYLQEKFRSAAVGAGTWDFETEIRRLDGEVRWIWVRGRFILNEMNQPIRAFGTVVDITERKQAEQALLRSEKLASVGRMAASIAHEINNPLESTINALYLAKGVENLPEATRGYLDIADAELKRITHITRQSLGFYRESNGPTSMTVTAVMESALDLLKSKIDKKRAIIERQWNEEGKITATAGELRQVFSNLLANSLDAIDPGGTIKLRVSGGLSVKNGRRYVRITIADNGRGIDRNSLQHLFEPFFTTKGAIGTGLGLWVSKQIVDKHDGSIRVRSKTDGPQMGTAFSVLLPAEPEAALSRTASAGVSGAPR